MAPRAFDYSKAKIYLLHSAKKQKYCVGSTTEELKNRLTRLKCENRIFIRTNDEQEMARFNDTKIYLLEEVPWVTSRKEMLLRVENWGLILERREERIRNGNV